MLPLPIKVWALKHSLLGNNPVDLLPIALKGEFEESARTLLSLFGDFSSS